MSSILITAIADLVFFGYQHNITFSFYISKWPALCIFLQKMALKCQKHQKQVQILRSSWNFIHHSNFTRYRTISQFNKFTCCNKLPKIKTHRHYHQSSWFASLQWSCAMSKFESFAEIKSVQILFRHRINNHFDKWNKFFKIVNRTYSTFLTVTSFYIFLHWSTHRPISSVVLKIVN